jgi:hypothetical protein
MAAAEAAERLGRFEEAVARSAARKLEEWS